MTAGVEFTQSDLPSTYLGVDLQHYDFNAKRVAEIAPRDFGLMQALQARGAIECCIFSDELNSPPGGVAVRHKFYEDYDGEKLDYVFFDPSRINGFNHIDDVRGLTEWLSKHLAPGGVCFAVLRTGLVQTDWDVFNPILLTPIGRLPSSPYLYDVLLRDFAVRPLIRLKEPDHSRYCVSRIFRIGRRQPTLMLILGHSQAGKTTLARELRLNAPNSHLSSDYIFFNLFQHRSSPASPEASRLIELLGSGSAEATGNFFRTLEKDNDIFSEYLSLAHSLMPTHSNIISMDIDLREQSNIDFAKAYFERMGYSVWLVTR